MKRYSHNWCKKKFIFAFTILCEGYSYLYPAPFHSKFLSSNYWEKYASFLRFCAHFFIICAPSAHKIDSLEYLYPAAPQPFEISKPVNFWKISVGCCCVRLFKYFFTIIHRKKKKGIFTVYCRYSQCLQYFFQLSIFYTIFVAIYTVLNCPCLTVQNSENHHWNLFSVRASRLISCE